MYISIDEIYKIKNDFTEEEKNLIRKAYNIGKKYHEGQFRKSGEPYFNHCVQTAINISRQNMGATVVAAGLLHDTLEDTSYTEEMMLTDFGEEITKLVNGVTKLGKLKYNGQERHVESLRKFFVAMSNDIRVVIIKLCDRLHNIQTLEYVREDKRHRIALETIEIHARLADRLGMGKLKAELEDAAFPYVFKEEYEKTKKLLSEAHVPSAEKLSQIAKKLDEELTILDIKIDKVDHRIKHLYSLWQKLKKRDYDIKKIYDLIALRVLVPTIADCYQALGVIHGLYKPVPNRFKDYIAIPKPNGYQSLHTTVFSGDGTMLEIQIRTHEMHEEAEYGIASHLSYKENSENGAKLTKKTMWTAELLAWQKDVTHHEEFMERLRHDFFEHRVFVITPKGDVIDLPDGSTPIDFAYHIHSDIGDKIARAYINNKLVSLDTKLKNRDVVKIETSDKSRPNRKWLNMCKTTLAKRHIRTYIREHGGIIDKVLLTKNLVGK